MATYKDGGYYWVKVISQDFGVSKNKGTPEFSLRVLVKGAVNPEDPAGDLLPCEQAERTIYKYITEATAERFAEEMARLGFDKDSFRFLDPRTEGYHSFTGAEFEAKCKHDPYEGKVTEKWEIALPRGTLTAKPIDDKDVRTLDSLFGKHLKKAASKRPAKAPAEALAAAKETAAAQAASSGDDIPF